MAPWGCPACQRDETKAIRMDSAVQTWMKTPGGELFLAIIREKAGILPRDPAAMAEAWRLAKFHGLAPLVAGFILSHPQLDWPVAVWDDAKKSRDFALFRNIQLLALLGGIQKALAGAGIPWISLKGPVFTEEYAGTPGLRASSDLDVLVHPEDVTRVDELFHGIGIISRTPKRPDAHRLGVLWNNHQYSSAAPKYLVELHWNMVWRTCYEIVDPNLAFRRARIAHVAAGAFPVLSPEDALLLAAMHAFEHRWDRLYHAKTLDWILRHPPRPLDWETILGTAREYHKTRVLLLGLELTREWLGAELPGQVNDLIQLDPVLAMLQDEVGDNFCGAGPANSSWSTMRFKWRALETRRDRITLFFRPVIKRAIWRK
jgi:hypothetical protein